MKHKYFDIVPATKRKLSPDEFRRALRGAGLLPVDNGQFRWRVAEEYNSPEIHDVYLVNFPEPCILFSNTETLKISCPYCGVDISICDWHSKLSKWREKGSKDYIVQTSCCKGSVDLRELHYAPHVFFTSTAVTICAPKTSTAPVDFIKRLEIAIGNKLECIERLC